MKKGFNKIAIASMLTVIVIISILAVLRINNKDNVEVIESDTTLNVTEAENTTEPIEETADIEVPDAHNMIDFTNNKELPMPVYNEKIEWVGKKGTGDFNYGEALQKALIFYEFQKSGKLPANRRVNWRGDSGLTDGQDVGLDLTGGFYDAGDHVKFNLPMAYTATMLAWSVYEDKDSYIESEQLPYMLDTIKYANDYFIKCHPEPNVYYYQVGSGSADHAWWGPAEVMQMERPSYKVDNDNPGSTVVAGTAASLAACSVVFKDINPAYSKECLKHAKELYTFAETTKSDAGYTAATGFYDSWSGFYDELSWAGVWLYIATDDENYLKKAEEYAALSKGDYIWTHCWDDVYTGSVLLLSKLTGKDEYKNKVEKNLDFWTVGTEGKKIHYTPKGLAWLSQWGSLRYATTSAFIALSYSEWEGCPKDKKKIYFDFAESQINYALGSTGRSYVVGYGENPPLQPHHRTSQGSWSNDMRKPSPNRHILYGALVGGPIMNDIYTDDVANYTTNEVACDYNAGFIGALAKLYKIYGGQHIKDFNAIEKVDEDEFYVDAGVNVSGDDFVEIKAIVYNKSGWPARVLDKLSLRYFFDASEIIATGGSINDITVTTNYTEGGKAAGVKKWNEAQNIYYVEIDFSGEKIYPGGQSSYKKEVQFRISAKGWDNKNDHSFKGIDSVTSGNLVKASNICLYDAGEHLFGNEPGGKSKEETSSSQEDIDNSKRDTATDNQAKNDNPSNTQIKQTTAKGDKVAIQAENKSSSNTIALTLEVTNISEEPISLSSLDLRYYFTPDTLSNCKFWCDHSAVLSGDNYQSVGSVSGDFIKLSKPTKDATYYCKINSSDNILLSPSAKWQVQFRIAKEDWSNFDLSNDFSFSETSKIAVFSNNKKIAGIEPAK